MTKYLAESANYKITAEFETVFLQLKNESQRKIVIGDFYGDPACAIISRDEKYAVIAGYGLIIYNLVKPFKAYKYNLISSSQFSEFYRFKPHLKIILALYQEIAEDNSLFKFVAYQGNKEAIFEMNSETFEISIMIE